MTSSYPDEWELPLPYDPPGGEYIGPGLGGNPSAYPPTTPGWEPARQQGGSASPPYDMADQLLTGIRVYYGGNYRGDYRAFQEPWATPRRRVANDKIGAYGLDGNAWPMDAEFAGIPGANMNDPAAQDRVARHKATWLNERYRGDWDLTALAWLHGAWVADDVLENGWRSLPYEKREQFDAFMSRVGPYIGESRYVVGRHTSGYGHRNLVGQGGEPLTDVGTNTRYGESSYYSPSMTDEIGGQGNHPYGSRTRSGVATLLDTGPGLLPGSRLVVSMFDQLSRRVAGGNRTPIDQLVDTADFGETIYGDQTPEGVETGETQGGLLAYTTRTEGDEVYSGGGQSWSSGWQSTHTINTNAQRLADTDYQNIAANAVTPIGQWLEENMGVSVAQYRDLNVRPQGGALYSDHYWGGALDVSGSREQLDAVSAWVEQYGNELGVNYKLWQVDNHYDHVHISFLPPASAGAITDGNEALTAVGLIKPTAEPLEEKLKTQRVGADVGAYTTPGNVR